LFADKVKVKQHFL